MAASQLKVFSFLGRNYGIKKNTNGDVSRMLFYVILWTLWLSRNDVMLLLTIKFWKKYKYLI